MNISRFNFLGIAILVCFAVACQTDNVSNAEVREPVVAGKFYPESAPRLKLAVEKFLEDAVPAKVKKPVAIIVPHAGYIYSGQICADGFKQVSHQSYDVVVVLGTNHTSPDLNGAAVYPGDGFRTPLGTVSVDKGIISLLVKEAPTDCTLDKATHASEHSIEVVLPFIQVAFPKAKTVPIIVGSHDISILTRFGQALARVLKNKKALIVVSTDLSHYPPQEDARIVDREILTAITTLDPAELSKAIRKNMNKNISNLATCACGEAPVIAAMIAAKSLGAVRGEIVSYANSGDVSIGERSRVVGYGAVVLTADDKGKEIIRPSKPALPADSSILSLNDKKNLLRFARKTIARVFATDTTPLARDFSPNLQQPRGVFVTLKKKGELRGCIGHMFADEPLGKLVGTMALQAAFHDRRFPPLTAEELQDIEIEISVLTPMKRVTGTSDILVGRDGVLLSKDGQSAVFLPQVATEQGWSREEMLNHLCQKAGLNANCWRQNAQFSTFQALVFSESEFK
ncbi:MAG TPA: AmmeMemoRadiSam system protein B [Smithella sp.]|nr:AmmeMemoRadiSam system protein B [Smithella sp.]HOG90528.1 AmmeMemoRadiSam system protein B [Smithella sp.]